MPPRISVILPTYNRHRFLFEAAMSILNQTFQDLELIVVDDGSTDSTPQIMESICREDARAIYLALPHVGRSHARNQALKIAQGEFIAFQDSDDISLANRLEKQLEVMQKNPGLGMVYCSTLSIDENGKRLNHGYIVKPTSDLYGEIVANNYRAIGPMSAMIRAEVIKEVGPYDEILDRFEDLDFYLRISRRYPTEAIVEPLVHARLHDDNSMPSQKPSEVLRNLDYYTSKVIENDQSHTPARALQASLGRLYLLYAREISKYFGLKSYLPFFVKASHLLRSWKPMVWFILAVLRLTQPAEQFLYRRAAGVNTR